jgi:hypothetical protein
MEKWCKNIKREGVGYMGKKAILLISILLVLSFTIFAANFEVGGGITYGGVSNQMVYKDEDISAKEAYPYAAFGINVNGTYWFNQKMGVEVDFDFSRATIYTLSVKIEGDSASAKEISQLLGPAGYFKYNLLTFPAVVNLKAGGGYYFYSDTYKEKSEGSEESSKLTGNGFAVYVGADAIMPIPEIFSIRIDNLKLKADVGYTVFSRIGKLEAEGETQEHTSLSINGLKLGLGVIYNF